MGLLDALRRHSQRGESGRPRVDAEEDSRTLCSPVSGRVITMAEVPDPVFSSETLGKGCAIWPEDSTVFAPISGTVNVVMGHAVGLTGDDGVEVLVHVGIDTIEMGGTGFEPLVTVGEHVRVGEGLLSIDRAAIKAAGHPDCVVLAVSDAADHGDIALVAEPGETVKAGETVLRFAR